VPALAFTAAFAVAGFSSVVRLFAPPGGGRMAALSHLLMSVAMIGMAWGWPGPGTSAGIVQLVVFGLLAAAFVPRVLRPAAPGRGGSAHHLLVLVAMVWMLADSGHHHAAPLWMQVITLAFLILLGSSALAPVTEEHRSSRLDTAGHVLMSGGMAGMFLTML
jgi:peptidoglycan/LPS O-acetylase OafA/YrhL